MLYFLWLLVSSSTAALLAGIWAYTSGMIAGREDGERVERARMAEEYNRVANLLHLANKDRDHWQAKWQGLLKHVEATVKATTGRPPCEK